jgi:DNA gyrase subunit B
MTNTYSEKDIKSYKGTEAVRKRPGMYLGTGEAATHQTFYEIFSNSVDEYLAGHCNQIIVTLEDYEGLDYLTIEDNGRGIPYKEKDIKGKKISAAILAATDLHAGGKFDNNSYAVSGGTHGVGLTSTNAVSSYFEVTIKRDGFIHNFICEKGKVIQSLTKIGKTKETGTKVHFTLDPEIMEFVKYDEKRIKETLVLSSYLNPGLSIIFCNKRDGKKDETYLSKNGAKDFVTDKLGKEKNILDEIFYINDDYKGIHVEVAFTYTNTENEIIETFVNGISTAQGGTHLTGFRLAVSLVINDLLRKVIPEKQQIPIHKDDLREGLVAVISIKMKNPSYHSQTKDSLGSKEAQGAVQTLVKNFLQDLYERNESKMKIILNRVITAAKSRLAAKRARETERKKIFSEDKLDLPIKLKDCISKDPKECELFIVEGNSAAGSAGEARDVITQAVLSLRGKILNTLNLKTSLILKNAEINSIVSSLGCGIDTTFDINNLRYDKIIIMTDADVDGSHICLLLLTLFYFHLRPLIDNNKIYIAKSPLYTIKKAGKVVGYLNTEKSRELWTIKKVNDVLKKDFTSIEEINNSLIEKATKNYSLNYLKGLGELDPDDLEKSTMNPKFRTLIKINMEKAKLAAKYFDICMNSNSVKERSEFIMNNCKFANLDI